MNDECAEGTLIDETLEANKELCSLGMIQIGKPIIITIDGREHNIVVTKIGKHYLHGYVAANRVAFLYSEEKNLNLRALIVSDGDFRAITNVPSNKLIANAPCILGLPELKMCAKIQDIKLFEYPWRPFVDGIAVDKDGVVIDAEVVNDAIPMFANHYLGNGKFVETPNAWPKAESTSYLKIVENEESSEDPISEKGKI